MAENAPGTFRQRIAHGEMHVRQRRARQHGQNKAHQSQAEQRPAPRQPGMTLTQHLASPETQQHRKQIGHIAKQAQQQIGAERPYPAHGIAHRIHVAHIGPAGIAAIETD